MSDKFSIAPRPQYVGSKPSQASLIERREYLRKHHQQTLERVNNLVSSQQEISQELGENLAAMQGNGQRLDELNDGASERGMLAALTRTFNRRRLIMERKSVAEELLNRYEHVSHKLRQASAFSDELRLTALEMQEEVENLHGEFSQARTNERLAAKRVKALEEKLSALEDGSIEMDAGEKEQWMDRLQFEERSESLSIELFRAQAELLQQEIAPARALRNTVMGMHEEMAHFVLAATARVNSAGHKIQALGMAADAPTVINELNESLAELSDAMDATEAYVSQAQELLTRVLPEMSRSLSVTAGVEALELTNDLKDMSRERARNLAEQALREAAMNEVESCLNEKTL